MSALGNLGQAVTYRVGQPVFPSLHAALGSGYRPLGHPCIGRDLGGMYVDLVNRRGHLARAVLTSEEWYLQILRTAVGRDLIATHSVDGVFKGSALLGVLEGHLVRRGRTLARARA